MKFFSIHHLLHRLQRRARPDRRFVNSLRQTLMEAGFLPASRRVLSGVEGFSFWHSWKMAAASLSMIMSLGTGTVVYAYASDAVLPDHPLYPIRTTIEQAEWQFARSLEEKERIQFRHTRRHVRELRQFSIRDQMPPQAHRQRILQELKQASASSSVFGDESDELQKYLREILKIERRELNEIFNQQQEASNEDDLKETRGLLKNQAEEIDQHMGSLERRVERRKQLLKDRDSQALNEELNEDLIDEE
ncbi:MAG: hypothetical protein Q7N87_02715 [Candidatus Uhrbacteria bacterium]|nr:hypothetical protein [Candidatus Uhrbacteria bacterium]